MVKKAGTRTILTYNSTIDALDMQFYCATFDSAYDSHIPMVMEDLMQMLLMGGEL